MSFIWPAALLSLLAVPLLVAGYLLLLRNAAAEREALGSMGVVVSSRSTRSDSRPAGPRRPAGPLRHLPYAIFGLALVALAVGAARPQLDVELPKRSGTVVLAIDTSASMTATDVQPSRLEVAKQAAQGFVEAQPGSIDVGVVSFGRGGFVVQEPTEVTDDVSAAIERLAPEGATSLGAGVFTALDLIVEEPLPVPAHVGETPASNSAPADIGFYGSATVIVFTDGEDTSDLDTMAVAALASTAGVKVHTIGVGTTTGAVVEVEGVSRATALDEAILKAIADTTSAVYFGADADADLGAVYDQIDLNLEVEAGQTEVTALAGAVGVALLALGAVLSMVFFGRAP